ncbi:MAG: hypothetical protein U9P49_04905 [Thermodesulfobacteriota bacterium]|nr:hypothetical protein [Thermodesulfobacteriota bacterium]
MSTGSNSKGWVLVYAMLFILIIQASAMAVATLIISKTKASSAYYTITKEIHEATYPGESSQYLNMTLDTPQGWDHKYFLTQISRKDMGDNPCIRSLYWRVKLREQPYQTVSKPSLSCSRPYLIILIDDSESMNWACREDFDTNSAYLKRPAGEIIKVSTDFEVSTVVERTEGTYFKGDYGNSYFAAPFNKYFNSTMPRWTKVYSGVTGLIDEFGMIHVAIATTSKGIILPFTEETEELYTTIDNIHPTHSSSPLAEALFAVINEFPDKCITDKHILIVTDGESICDGNLPKDIQDFDRDYDTMDRYIKGMGSKCLDDVAAYAFSLGIRIHVTGPGTKVEFLKDVAEKGGGEYMPGASVFLPEDKFICQMPVMQDDSILFLTNRNARFDPTWLEYEDAIYYDVCESLKLCLCAKHYIKGIANSMYQKGDILYCSTSQDYIMAISLPDKRLKWAIKGPGGKIVARNNSIVVGPNTKGDIYGINAEPTILWAYKGSCMDTSESSVYVAKGTDISLLDISTGREQGLFTLMNPITTISYDPCYGIVLVGTASGDIYIFSQDLELIRMITTNSGEGIKGLHSFHTGKQLYIVALTDGFVIGARQDSVLWSHAVSIPCTQAIVMDSKVYITAWEEEAPCGGIDTNRSTLTIIDAITGEYISGKAVLSGRVFGPVINLANTRIGYANWLSQIVMEDIASLDGTSLCYLGTKILH